MSLVALYLNPPEPRYIELLRSLVAPSVTITTDETQTDYDVLIGGRPQREHLTRSDRLRHLIVPWAGIPQTVKQTLPDFPQISVHNSHYNSRPVAEFALALLLAAAKQIMLFDRALRQDDWRPRYQESGSLLLADLRVLILGYGAIGRELAAMCRGLGMKVTATRRSLDAPREADGVRQYPASHMSDLLSEVDALVCCLPLTDTTRGLIGREELALLPDHAVVVNIGRGDIFDQQALYAALQTKIIGAAGLDVWYNYPRDEASRQATPPADYPFAELENVVMTPHTASALANGKGYELQMQSLARLLNAAARGEPMPNQVDLTQGY